MVKRNFYFSYFVLLIAFVFGFLIIRSVYAALSCSVTTDCSSGIVIFRMSGTTNAHDELPNQSNYTQLVCCSGVTDLGNSCSGSYAIALKLSGQTNSHAEQSSQTNYGNNACISVPAGSSVSVGYQTDNCDGFQATLASISGTGITNAHVGNGDAYSTKICASVTTANISVSISDGIVTYGTLGQNATKSTLSGELNDMQTATNDGTVTETFNIRGQDSVNWTLGTIAGSDIYVHRFCNDTANDCSSHRRITLL